MHNVAILILLDGPDGTIAGKSRHGPAATVQPKRFAKAGDLHTNMPTPTAVNERLACTLTVK